MGCDQCQNYVFQNSVAVRTFRNRVYTFRNGGYTFRNRGYTFRNGGYTFRNRGYTFRNGGYTFRNRIYTFHNRGYTFHNRGYTFRNRVYTFRNRGYTFRNRIYTFRNRVYTFRNRGYTFRNRVYTFCNRGYTLHNRGYTFRNRVYTFCIRGYTLHNRVFTFRNRVYIFCNRGYTFRNRAENTRTYGAYKTASTRCSWMASQNNGNFRQQAVATANLLLEAASLLESSQSTTTHAPQQSPRQVTLDRTLRRNGGEHAGPSRPSATAELRGLFNWNSRSSTKANKRKATPTSLARPKKARRGHTWTHTWVCMSGIADETVPDANERVTLKMAGLGERRFAIDVASTAQDLCDALDSQFPRLVNGGGFELLRASEGCPRELEVIPIPDDGYTAEYLKAIVYNAKLYIRPLQTDLSLEPCTGDVSTAVGINRLPALYIHGKG